MTKTTNAPTIAALLGLEYDDPWDRRTELQKTRAAANRAMSEALETNAESAMPPRFVDPPDDENLSIAGSGRSMHRITVTGRKLSVVIAAEPCLLDVALTARNTAVGCWLALTSGRVAERLVAALQNHNMTIVLERVGCDGQPVSSQPTEADSEAMLA